MLPRIVPEFLVRVAKTPIPPVPASARTVCALLGLLLVLPGVGCGGSSTPVSPPPPPGMARASGSVFGGRPVVGATVAFVAAADVDASDSVQPVEDLAPAATARAVTDRDGRFSVDLEAGRYFVHVTPAADDAIHLPGGDYSRSSLDLEDGSTAIFGIKLSEKPSDGATYVGSTTCLGCHPGQATATKTLHFLGLRALGPAGTLPSSLQDLSLFPDHDAALAFFVDGGPDDNTGSSTDGYGYRIATSSGYSILLGRDGSGHFQAIESEDRSRVSERLYVPFTYGGEGRFKQLFLTRLDASGAYSATATVGSYHPLPAQYSETEGIPAQGGEVTAPEWVLYYPGRWSAPSVDGGPAGGSPLPDQSFDNQCSGCHFTGMSLERSGDGLFRAGAVDDPGGPFDYDGDGQRDEINIGCERCHGPGSEHAAQAKGSIVQPEYLAPGRANMICGQCHNHGMGNGTIDGEGRGEFASRNDASTGALEFVTAGLAPAEFFGQASGSGIQPSFGTSGGFFDPIDLRTSDGSWQDRTGGFDSHFDHSKDQRQHYLDHVRSKHGKNPYEMAACWDCHDAHGSDRRAQATAAVESNVMCLRCHAGFGDFAAVTQEMVDEVESGGAQTAEINEGLHQHQLLNTFELVEVAMNLGPDAYANPAGASRLGRCVTCHYPKTARSASWIEDDEGFLIRGDISSHVLRTISPRTSQAMATAGLDPVPNSCVDCHRGSTRGAWPDYRYRKE